MSTLNSYTCRALELRTAKYYAHIRKPESEWKTIEDLAPQLAEFEHLVKAREYDAACQVLDSNATHLFLWGYYALLVAMRKTLVGKIQSLTLQLNNLEGMADALRATGELQSAIAHYEQGLILAHCLGDRAREAKLQGDLGSAYRVLGQREKSLALYESALAISREIGDRREECRQLGHLGRIYGVLGGFTQAIEAHKKAIEIARETNNRQLEGYNLGTLGNIYRALGQFETARTLYEMALMIAYEIGERREEGVRHRSLGEIYRVLGNTEKAVTFFQIALARSRDIAYRVGEENTLGSLGNVYIDLEDYGKAQEYHTEALRISREIGYRTGQEYSVLGLARIKLATDNLTEAQQLCEEALSLYAEEVDYHIALILGIVYLRQKSAKAPEIIQDAILRCQRLLTQYREWYAPQYVFATALVGQAVCGSRWLDPPQRTDLLAPALTEYRRALDITSAPGVVRDALRDLGLIRAAGIKGLEPAFVLLEQAISDWQPLSDDALPSPTSSQEDTL